LNLWMGQQKNMPQMSLLITCMHRLMMKVVEGFECVYPH
jgi:hypothetical protein